MQTNDDVVDAAVSFDGTWAKRGFTSLTGVVFVLSVDTGEVLDYHVLSKSCQTCTRTRMNVLIHWFGCGAPNTSTMG